MTIETCGPRPSVVVRSAPGRDRAQPRVIAAPGAEVRDGVHEPGGVAECFPAVTLPGEACGIDRLAREVRGRDEMARVEPAHAPEGAQEAAVAENEDGRRSSALPVAIEEPVRREPLRRDPMIDARRGRIVNLPARLLHAVAHIRLLVEELLPAPQAHPGREAP